MMRTLAVWLGLLAAVIGCYAAETTQAEVSGAFGVATVQLPGAPEEALRHGMPLTEGAILRTASGSAVDLHLGAEAGVIRLTQNTMVTITMLRATNAHFETYLNLQHGAILGNGARIRAGSRYQIKTAAGIAAIGNAAFRLHAEGYFVVIEGSAQYAFVPAEGDVQLQTLSAPPAVYFSPAEGIKEAPKALVREIVNQSKARLGTTAK